MRKQICTALVSCLTLSIASAQVPAPQLVCQRLATDRCGGGGSGGTVGVPTLLGPIVYGSAQWSYTPPNDGINHVAFNYNIPNIDRTIWGSSCANGASSKVSVLVVNQDLYSTIGSTTEIPAASIISQSTMSYSTTNPLSKALTSAVEAAATPGTNWSIVVREGNWGRYKGGLAPGEWVRNASVCKLYLTPPPPIYNPPVVFGP